MFANWNGMEQEVMMQGNAGFDTGTGDLGYANANYRMNKSMNDANGVNGTGVNGYGQVNNQL